MTVALFDFDSTITMRDTMRPFARYAAQRYHCRWKMGLIYILLCAFKAKCIKDVFLKESFLNLFFAGRSVHEVNSAAQDFLRANLERDGFIRPGVFEKLRAHVASGDEVYLVSANFDFFLAPLAGLWQLKGIIATKTMTSDGIVTGKIVGIPCKGAEKRVRVCAVIGADEIKKAIVYGDSEDSDLMSAAGQAFFSDAI